MTASTSKTRLAVGLFGVEERLAAALAELGSQGLAPARTSVIARADAFGGSLAGWLTRKEATASANWIVYGSAGDTDRRAIAPAGADEASPIAGPTDGNDARALLGFHRWVPQRHAQLMHRCIDEGGALLLVEPDSEAEERTACAVLLRYASGGVQTHEIARPQESQAARSRGDSI
jgi:hypothetical protein